MTRGRLACSLLAASLLASACGSSGNGEADKTAAQILADAVSAMRTTSSFHISGQETSSGTGTPNPLGNISLSIDIAGPSSAQGTIGGEGVTAKFVITGGKFYLQGKEFFAKVAGDQAANLVGDRWVVAPSTSGISGFDQFVDAKKLANCLNLDHGALSKGGTTTVNGQTAVILVDKGDKPGTQPGKLYVATSGTAYLLKLETTGAAQPGTPPGGDQCGSSGDTSTGAILFSDFGKSYSVSAPSDAVDLQSLLSGG